MANELFFSGIEDKISSFFDADGLQNKNDIQSLNNSLIIGDERTPAHEVFLDAITRSDINDNTVVMISIVKAHNVSRALALMNNGEVSLDKILDISGAKAALDEFSVCA